MLEHEKPVFIQGLFRSRTTYLLSEFAKDPKNKIFNEPLHPLAGNENLKLSPKSLRHPPLPPESFAKYPEGILVPVDLGIKRYFLKADEDLPELQNYINTLIISTEERPVFKFVRMALRGNWTSDKFPGTHIYIDRDLSELINSYYSFHGRFSWYLTELTTIVGTNSDQPVFSELADYMGLTKVDGNYYELRRHFGKISAANFKDGRYSKETMIDMVAFFREIALAEAESYAAAVITSEDLRNPEKRKKTAEILTDLTGSLIDMSGYKDKKPKEFLSPSSNMVALIENARQLV